VYFWRYTLAKKHGAHPVLTVKSIGVGSNPTEKWKVNWIGVDQLALHFRVGFEPAQRGEFQLPTLT